MTPPPCMTCGEPVKPRQTGHRMRPKTGLRVIDGVIWCWYCSRQCSGKRAGTRSVEQQRHLVNLAAEKRARAVLARRQREYAEDVAALLRYGVPRVLAVAMLDRVFQRGDHAGYNRAYYRFAAREQRTA